MDTENGTLDEVDILGDWQSDTTASNLTTQKVEPYIPEMSVDFEIDVVGGENLPNADSLMLGIVTEAVSNRTVESPTPGPSGINQYSSGNEDFQVDSDESIEIIEIPKKSVQVIVLTDSSSESDVDVIEIAAKLPKKAKKEVKTIKEKLEDCKDKIFRVKSEADCEGKSPPNKHDITCSICLGVYDNRAFLNECFHSFCYTCILQWAKVVHTCPLCKSAFRSIIYDIKPDLQYKQDFLNKLANSTAQFSSPPHTFESWLGTGQRFRYRTTFTSVGNHISDWHRQCSYDRLRYSLSAQSQRRRRRRSLWGEGQSSTWGRVAASEERRRSVYSLGMVIKEIKHPPGRVKYRDISVKFFQDNPAVTHRLVPWILRDLKIILPSNCDDASFVLHLIISFLQSFPMESDDFYNQLQPYLFNNTRQFIRELISFASSPYDMRTYDSRVVYDMPSALQSATTVAISQSTSTLQLQNAIDSGEEISLRDRLLDELFEEHDEDFSPRLRYLSSQTSKGAVENNGWSSEDSIIDVTGPITSAAPKIDLQEKKTDKNCDIINVSKPRNAGVSFGNRASDVVQSSSHCEFVASDSKSSDADVRGTDTAVRSWVNSKHGYGSPSSKRSPRTNMSPTFGYSRSTSKSSDRRNSQLEIVQPTTKSCWKSRNNFGLSHGDPKLSCSRSKSRFEKRTSTFPKPGKRHKDSYGSRSTPAEYVEGYWCLDSIDRRKEHRFRQSRSRSRDAEPAISELIRKELEWTHNEQSSLCKSRKLKSARWRESEEKHTLASQDRLNRVEKRSKLPLEELESKVGEEGQESKSIRSRESKECKERHRSRQSSWKSNESIKSKSALISYDSRSNRSSTRESKDYQKRHRSHSSRLKSNKSIKSQNALISYDSRSNRSSSRGSKDYQKRHRSHSSRSKSNKSIKSKNYFISHDSRSSRSSSRESKEYQNRHRSQSSRSKSSESIKSKNYLISYDSRLDRPKRALTASKLCELSRECYKQNLCKKHLLKFSSRLTKEPVESNSVQPILNGGDDFTDHISTKSPTQPSLDLVGFGKGVEKEALLEDEGSRNGCIVLALGERMNSPEYNLFKDASKVKTKIVKIKRRKGSQNKEKVAIENLKDGCEQITKSLHTAVKSCNYDEDERRRGNEFIEEVSVFKNSDGFGKDDGKCELLFSEDFHSNDEEFHKVGKSPRLDEDTLKNMDRVCESNHSTSQSNLSEVSGISKNTEPSYNSNRKNSLHLDANKINLSSTLDSNLSSSKPAYPDEKLTGALAKVKTASKMELSKYNPERIEKLALLDDSEIEACIRELNYKILENSEHLEKLKPSFELKDA